MNYVWDALQLSNYAVQMDNDGRYREAIYYYKEAFRLLNLAVSSFPNHEEVEAWKTKANEYIQRCKRLECTVLNANDKCEAKVNENDYQVNKCYFLMKQGLDADEIGNYDVAMELYTEAVDLALQMKDLITDSEALIKLNKITRNVLDRMALLKDSKKSDDERDTVDGGVGQLKVSGNDMLSDDEKRVLMIVSHINNNEFVPFMDIDLKERFQYKFEFTDKDGLLVLSPKQKSQFVCWARPHEFCSQPKVFTKPIPDFTTIKQTIVSDCSFVASLAVAAQCEKNTGRKLISSLIFPKKRNGQPVYNPFGKYMIKLHVNGVARKVIIDDQLPMGKYNELLCSHSIDKNEIWVSLLEKAYMKVMGGYDFPGSNSNIDLYTLTEWIPERFSLSQCNDSSDTDKIFNMLLSRMKSGDVLVTIATGELSQTDETRTGLVPTHAYAVLDVRQINDARLLKLKNPWSHIRWRGNYSELDMKNWTPSLKEALSFDPHDALTFDNGIFWIDYPSVLKFFDVLYMNWNPRMFTYTYSIHKSWDASVGPTKDVYNIGENPQFCLDVHDAKKGTVWILLSRHITKIDDFRDNKEYITLLVYKNNGKKVYYPFDPQPYIDGVRINSPHYLCKIPLNENSPRHFTLVVSQFEKHMTIYYTLRTFSTCPITLTEFVNKYKYLERVEGKWQGSNAGGCRNYPTYKNNTVYQLRVQSNNNNNSLLLEMRAPKQYKVGLEITLVKLDDESSVGKFLRLTSGDYRSGFVVLEINNVQPGAYHIVGSTFYAGEEGPYILTVSCTCPITLVQLTNAR